MKTRLNKLWLKLKALFKQGLTPKQLALSLVISLLVSIFPIFGISTIALACIAIPMRLNLPIMIASSYIFGPIKYLVLIPFVVLGARILGKEHTLLTYEAIKASYEESFFETASALSYELLCGLIGWLLTALPLGIIVYFLLKAMLTFFNKLKSKQPTTK